MRIFAMDGLFSKASLLRLAAPLAVLLAFLHPLRSASAEPSKTFKVGVLYWSMGIPGQVAMRKGLEAEAASINAAAKEKSLPQVVLEARVAGDGEEGIERQIVQMRELIAMKVDALIVQPTDNAALAAPLREANAAKIPVIAYDQYINGGVVDVFLSSDNYQAGYLDGEYIASKFGGGRELRLILVEYPHVSSTVERVNGFLDALAEAKIICKVLKSYNAVEPVGGLKAAESILKDFPEPSSVDAIFTVNDGGGLAVVDRLFKAGRKEVMVASIDGDPASVENIKAGRLTVVDSAQFCGPLGAEAMKAAYCVLTGAKTPSHALLPVFPVAKETLDLYPGWLGPMPSEFSKCWKSSSPQWKGVLKVVKP